jgi:hypothetical protein
MDISGAGNKRMGVAPGRHLDLRATGPFDLGDEAFMSSPHLPEWLEEEGDDADQNEQDAIIDGIME